MPGKKQKLKIYRHISLLPVLGKTLERFLHDRMFRFFTKISLIDSCTDQLLSITHEIYKSFDDGHEAWSVFLGMSNAFGKVWLKALIFKLK